MGASQNDQLKPTSNNPLGEPRADFILDQAIDTMRQRAADRDVEQERTMAKIVQIFNIMTGHTLSEVEGWKFMVVLKMVRAETGGFRADDYVDMAAYIGLTGEAHARA